MDDTRVTSVFGCARCGEDHAEVEFKRIKGRPIEDVDGTVWDWWGICPTTGDPILQRDLPEVDKKP